MVDLALALLELFSLLYLILVWRAGRSLYQGTDRDLKRAWRDVEPQRRKRIRRSLLRGEAVRDPADAVLALGAVAQLERVRRSLSPLSLVSPLLLLGLLVVLIAIDARWSVVVLGGVFAVLTTLWLATIWSWRRYRKSAAATRAVHGSRSVE
jgi:hypothetical protein